MTTRRGPIGRAVWAVMAVVAAAGPAAAADRPPNVLLILSDDHAYQAIGAYGAGLNRTPNLDRLAAAGMRFDRCLTTYSLCGPSRATILTGKYAHLNGFYNNDGGTKFDGTQVTFPKLLRAAGYQTAVVGKWHLGSTPTGFDHWEILPGQGQYYNPPMTVDGRRVVKHGYVTDVLTDDALDWLRHGRDAGKPFYLQLAHKAPHRNWEPSLANLALYDGVAFPEPPTLFDDYAGRGQAEREQRMRIDTVLTDDDLKLTPPPEMDADQRRAWDAYYDPRNQAFRDRHLAGAELARWKYQRYMHDYMATVASVDQSVGRVLDYLAEAGLDRDTVVIYTSDQGFFLGEHGWFDKRWIFEQSLRTPLLVRWPGVTAAGSATGAMVSNLDLAETVLDAAGVAVPAEMQGRSFVPVLRGQTPADWRRAFYYHYYEHPAVHNVARHYGVVTDRYKLVHFYEPATDYWELFDLQADPMELTSLYGRPEVAAVQADLHRELDRLRAELKVPDPDPPAAALPRRRP